MLALVTLPHTLKAAAVSVTATVSVTLCTGVTRGTQALVVGGTRTVAMDTVIVAPEKTLTMVKN